ncbi:thioredoxin-like protein [Backusella circina FSU 941]|nr:thioredoxin-like protein [Backusella circina FSU 941]
MEDALWAQLQNASLEDNDKRNESETESEPDDEDIQNDTMSGPDLSSRTKGPQTGPKGVKADRDYYEYQQKQEQSEQRRQHNERMKQKAFTTTTYLEDQQELVLQQLEEDSDEEVLKEYRKKRIAELKNMSNNHAIRKQQRVFGNVATVDVDDYVAAIDDEWKSVPVIAHLYDDSLPMCRLLDDIFVGLASKYALAKFIRVSALDLEFDLVGSPSILAYQNGVLVANLVRIIDQVGSRFDGDSIEDILLRHGALSENDLYDIPRKSDEEDNL